jgi:hypothetical protein
MEECHSGDRGRLIGEDVYEPEPSKAELFKLDPADVLTNGGVRQAARTVYQAAPIFR